MRDKSPTFIIRDIANEQRDEEAIDRFFKLADDNATRAVAALHLIGVLIQEQIDAAGIDKDSIPTASMYAVLMAMKHYPKIGELLLDLIGQLEDSGMPSIINGIVEIFKEMELEAYLVNEAPTV